jgi:hypothetical protein
VKIQLNPSLPRARQLDQHSQQVDVNIQQIAGFSAGTYGEFPPEATISCTPCKTAAMRLLPGFPDLLGLNAASDGIEDGQLCLLNRRDGVVDRETRLPLKSLGISFSAPGLSLSFSLGNSGLQRLDVGGDFRF